MLLSVGGNGRSYVLILEAGPLADTSQSKKYFARMTTKVGYCRVRTVSTMMLLHELPISIALVVCFRKLFALNLHFCRLEYHFHPFDQ